MPTAKSNSSPSNFRKLSVNSSDSLGPFFFFFLSRCQGANTLELSGLNGIVQSLKPLQIRSVGELGRGPGRSGCRRDCTCQFSITEQPLWPVGPALSMTIMFVHFPATFLACRTQNRTMSELARGLMFPPPKTLKQHTWPRWLQRSHLWRLASSFLSTVFRHCLTPWNHWVIIDRTPVWF